MKRIQHENQYDEFEEMFPGSPPILYVYLGPVSKGVCQKKKRRTIEKKKKLQRYVLRDIHKKTRKMCVLNVKYITVHYIVIKHIFLTGLFFNSKCFIWNLRLLQQS